MLRVLHWCTDQTMTGALARMDLTAAQGHIMGYLAHSPNPPCSRDIEEAFQLSHPTVSGLLSRLEKKGFIEFRPDEKDRRCKRIHMLPKGQACIELMHRTIRENEERIVQGFSDEEKAQFASLLERAISNMGGSPCQRNQKEES
jgi:DNA-binding MarR family transcriptional regulator